MQELEELLDDDEDMSDMYLERKREARLAAAISDNEGSLEGLKEAASDEDPLAEDMAPSSQRRRSLAEPASPWASVALHAGQAAPEARGLCLHVHACMHIAEGRFCGIPSPSSCTCSWHMTSLS